MKPALFEYVQPQSLGEAVSLLKRHGGAKVIAGGQSLVPLMNFRLSRPEVLIDLTRIGELDQIRQEPSLLVTGALTRHQQLAENPVVAEHLPVLAKAARHIGHWAIRSRGTLGGSLAHADPAAELPAALVALSGSVVVQSDSGIRNIEADELLLGYFTTSLAADDVITAVKWPLPQAPMGFSEVVRRPGDFAVAGAFAELGAHAAVTWFGVGPRPQRIAVSQWPADDQDRRALLTELAGTLELEHHDEYKRSIAVHVALRAIQDAEGARE